MQLYGVELATYNLAMARLLEKAQQETDNERRWKAELDFCLAALGKDCVESELGGVKLSDVDLMALEHMFRAIVDVYETPQREATAAMIDSRLADIDIDKLVKVVELAERSRQGFAKVK